MNPFDEKHNRRARESLAEQGIEMTPDELQRERKAAYATIREEMKKRGHDVPDSDEELFLLIRESQLTYEERAALDSIDIDAIIREVTGETLEDQNKRHSAAAMKFFKQSCSEKKTRIQYQDIVYQCCNIVDKYNGKRPGQGITIEQLPDAIAALARLTRERDGLAKEARAMVKANEEYFKSNSSGAPPWFIFAHQNLVAALATCDEPITAESAGGEGG